jgi:AcrR family transcriptional regulator
MPRPVALTPRKSPTRTRAKASVDSILEATAALLDEVGFDGLTTNAIAERAGVNIASVYKYFPNKYAVLTALAERMRAEQVDMLGRHLAPGADWRTALDGVLGDMLKLFLERPGVAELSATLAASPALVPVQEESFDVEAATIARAMPAMGVDLPPADRQAIARVILEAVRGVLPLARRSTPAVRKRLLRELRRMLEAYIATIVEA